MLAWIAFDTGDPLGVKFTHINEYLGVSSKAEVVGHLKKHFSLQTEGDN